MFPDVTSAREHINGTGPRGGDGQQQVLELSTLPGLENVALAPSRRSFLLTLSRPTSADRRENAQADRDSESASGPPTMGRVVRTAATPCRDALATAQPTRCTRVRQCNPVRRVQLPLGCKTSVV